MRKLHLLLICGIVVAACVPQASAQQGAQFGIGIGLSSSAFSGDDFGALESVLSPTSIYLPITFAGFRLEPEVGLFRFSASGGDFESSVTVFQVGTGIFALRSSNSNNLYFGGRIGITRQSSSVDFPGGNDESSSSNFFLGPVTGAEHLFGDSFSLGGEAQVLYTSLGDEDDGDGGGDVSTSLLRTRAVLFVRWHL